eukprot:COSAG01_NODE_1602_length_9759_cov_35.078157_3_plen_1215_part_00
MPDRNVCRVGARWLSCALSQLLLLLFATRRGCNAACATHKYDCRACTQAREGWLNEKCEFCESATGSKRCSSSWGAVCPGSDFEWIDRSSKCPATNGARCPRGLYPSSSGCKSCDPGRYQDSNNFMGGHCSPCPGGKYQPYSASSSCITCPAGKFTDPLGQLGNPSGTSSCKDCPAGMTSLPGAVLPETYNVDGDGLDNVPCYAEVLGGNGCLKGTCACPSSCTSQSTSESSHWDSKARRMTNTCSCTCSGCDKACAAGWSREANSCEQCPPGLYQESESFSKTNTVSTWTSACKQCDAGKFSPTKASTNCIACPTGKTTVATKNFNSKGSDAWGSYTLVSATTFQCFSCGAGKYQGGGISLYGSNGYFHACTPCQPGRYQAWSSHVSPSCSLCPANTFRSSTGGQSSSSCLSCPSHKKSTKGASSCQTVTCGRGAYKAGRGCLYCPPGRYQASSGHTHTTCPACPRFTIPTSNRPVTSCSTCPSGKATFDANRRYVRSAGTQCLSHHCEPGYFKARNSCESCPPGRYQDENKYKGTSCTACAAGTYRSSTGGMSASSCSSCPSGKTSSVGATSVTSCKVACSAGQYRSGTSCAPCQVGSYQSLTSHTDTSCTPCSSAVGSGYTTSGSGSTTSAACIIECGTGQYSSFLVSRGVYSCQPCQVGRYQDTYKHTMTSCAACPTGKTTAQTGTAYDSQCTKACRTGQYRSGGVMSPTSCAPCQVGSYQSLTSHTDMSCTPCPSGRTTSGNGSTTSAACIIECGTGQHKFETSCHPCQVGRYQQSHGHTSTNCTACPTGKSTASTGATSVTSCKVACSAGQYRSGNSCAPCQVGSYQSLTSHTDISCTPCSSGYTTSGNGSTTSAACIIECGTGQYRSGVGSCQPCQVGRYQQSHGHTSTNCTACPTGKSTASTGATSVTSCKVACSAGQYRSGNSCAPCQVGSYQSLTSHTDTSCTPCSKWGGYTTSGNGSTTSAACIIECGTGQYRSGVGSCQPCQVGRYQQSHGHTSTNCTACPTGKSTASTGTTTVWFCEVACNAGQYRVGASCQSCEAGRYQPLVSHMDTSCTSCPSGKTSLEVESYDLKDCNIIAAHLVLSTDIATIPPGSSARTAFGASNCICFARAVILLFTGLLCHCVQRPTSREMSVEGCLLTKIALSSTPSVQAPQPLIFLSAQTRVANLSPSAQSFPLLPRWVLHSNLSAQRPSRRSHHRLFQRQH